MTLSSCCVGALALKRMSGREKPIPRFQRELFTICVAWRSIEDTLFIG
jgi:hypothetical protein